MRYLCRSPLALLLLLASGAHPHGGGLDSNGGHTDHSTGLYHCHREPCFSNVGDTEGQGGDDSDSAPFVTLYDRDNWRHWLDLDGDCQNTRHEVLIRDSQVDVTFASSRRCDVEEGLWRDPYTGKQFTMATDVDIDHVVPLKWAHGHGGDRWSGRKKTRFANDMENLVAVEDGVNQAKAAKGPDDWMPPAEGYRCEYLRKFVGVMEEYGLRFVAVEREALAGEFRRCQL